MDVDKKRQLENELTVMGLPGLDDPNLVQAMADVVNGYPLPAERADFFCEMLNECEGSRRREMYEAMRPRLSFDVPTLDQCEARIAARAERMIRPKSKVPSVKPEAKPESIVAELTCAGCRRVEQFDGRTVADAMGNARRAGWGRGPKRFEEYCPECRMAAMPVRVYGKSASASAAERIN